MEHRVRAMTFSELKKIVAELEQNQKVTDETKVFIDTGWDSVQELDPKAIHVEQVKEFTVEDVLTKEVFGGYSLVEKAQKMNAEGEEEAAIILRNLY